MPPGLAPPCALPLPAGPALTSLFFLFVAFVAYELLWAPLVLQMVLLLLLRPLQSLLDLQAERLLLS